MEAVAMHDFTATAEDELSFTKGSIIKVLNTAEDKNWYKAELEGNEGFVPHNYINMKPHPWYYGKITRSKAEDLMLGNKQPDGGFLVRMSESCPGDFSITVKFQNGVQHFKILRDTHGKYFLWVLKFNSINEIVEYHRKASVSRTHDIFFKDMINYDEETVIAKYDFDAQGGDELSFRKGDIIRVTEKVDHSWWRGEKNGRQGMFPKTYVEVVKNDSQMDEQGQQMVL